MGDMTLDHQITETGQSNCGDFWEEEKQTLLLKRFGLQGDLSAF